MISLLLQESGMGASMESKSVIPSGQSGMHLSPIVVCTSHIE